MELFGRSKMTNEYARVIDWNPRWATGAPLPQVFANGHTIYVTYIVDDRGPKWDGPLAKMVSNESGMVYSFALVEFDGATFRFGIANDEVFGGLPLWDKGLEGYSAHIIENSTWIDEIKNIHKVHDRFDEKHWTNKRHYVLLFQDEILEVIAKGYKIEVFETTSQQLAIEVAKRMNA